MKKLLTLLLALVSLTASAEDIGSLFAAMPDSIIPLLSRNNRLDCLDFYKSGMKNAVINKLSGRSRITGMNERTLSLHLSEASDAQLMLLKGQDNAPLIVMIYTYRSPALESVITLYGKDWHRLRTSDYISLPGVDDFIKEPSAKDDSTRSNLSNARDILTDAFVSATADSLGQKITFSLSTANLTSEETKQITPYIIPAKTFVWDGKRFAAAEE